MNSFKITVFVETCFPTIPKSETTRFLSQRVWRTETKYSAVLQTSLKKLHQVASHMRQNKSEHMYSWAGWLFLTIQHCVFLILMCFLANKTFFKNRFCDFVLTLYNVNVQPAAVLNLTDFSDDGQGLWTKDSLIQSSNVGILNY